MRKQIDIRVRKTVPFKCQYNLFEPENGRDCPSIVLVLRAKYCGFTKSLWIHQHN